LRRGGLTVGSDIFVAYSSEREDPGSVTHTMRSIPKVVGGFDDQSLSLAEALYSTAFPSIHKVSSCRVAEASKIVENVYRCVNIALVNELKMIFDKMNIDVWEVLDASATKPFGFHRFNPGPGWGGHCIPVDPFYLAHRARSFGMETHFVQRAGEINAHMPSYVVSKITLALNDRCKSVNGSRVLIVGVAYKVRASSNSIQNTNATPRFSPHSPTLCNACLSLP
jgi:UDP-N-acetyl-D-glucosamine dehydrogenase